VNVEELIGEVRQRLPMEIKSILHYVTTKTGRKCVLFPDLDAEENWMQVDRGVYVIINHDLEEFEVFCSDAQKSAKIPVASIIYVLLADKDIDKSKLYVVDLGVVEAT
jgi:hypothetical protein